LKETGGSILSFFKHFSMPSRIKLETSGEQKVLVRIIFPKPALFIVFALLFSLFQHPPSASAALFGRELRVGVAVSPNFKQSPSWKQDFERRLAYASKIFETEFKIKFTVRMYWDWPLADEKVMPSAMLEDLRARYSLQGVDLVIGLSHLSNADELAKVKDLHTIGQARPFGGYVLLRYPQNPLYKIQEETVLAHELGHLFGAIHSNDPQSIMSPVVELQIPTRFDQQNREIIRMTRDMDFSRGMESVSPALSGQLAASYLKMIQTEQSADFFHSLGLFYLKMGQTKEALNAWTKAREMAPDSYVIRYNLGYLNFQLGDYDRAIRELGGAAAMLVLPSQKKEKSRVLDALASSYSKKENYFSAHRTWNQALALDPSNTQIKVNLAVLKLLMGHEDEAIQDFERFLKKDPSNPKLLTYVGSAYYRKGRYEQAIEYLNQALTLLQSKKKMDKSKMPDQNQIYDIYQNLAASHLKLEQSTQAVAYLRKACEMRPSLGCREKLGNLYYQLSRWDECVQELVAVLEKRKDDPNLYAKVGVAFSKKGDNRNAVSLFREGLRYTNEKAQKSVIHKNIGFSLIQLQQWDMALQDFQFALSHNYNDAESHMGLGIVKMKKTNLAGASESLEMALKINPKLAQAQSLLKSVRESMKQGAGGPTRARFVPAGGTATQDAR